MSQVQAWELLHTPDYCGKLTMLELRSLLLRAGYPMKVVTKLANQRGEERLAAQVMM